MKSIIPQARQAIAEYNRAAELLQVAKDMPPAKKVKLAPYCAVILELWRKEYSCAAIADFLTNQLGRKVSRSQVFGYMKRNPLIFDDGRIKAFNRWSETMVKTGKPQKISFKTTHPTEGVVHWTGTVKVTRVPKRLNVVEGLPPDFYMRKGTGLYRLEKEGDGSSEWVLARRLKKPRGEK